MLVIIAWPSVTQNHPIFDSANTKWPPFFEFLHQKTPTVLTQGGGGQACSEHLALTHFGQNNLALTRN